MRRTLGKPVLIVLTCLALGVTAACGSSSSTTGPASGPASDPAGSPSRTPGTVEGAKVLPLISMTGAGGQPQPTASPLDTPAQVRAFARQFPTPAVAARIQHVVDDARKPGYDVVGQVVMVGCDHPPGAAVVVDGGGDVVLVPREVASPLEECLVAVTTVAIALLPAS